MIDVTQQTICFLHPRWWCLSLQSSATAILAEAFVNKMQLWKELAWILCQEILLGEQVPLGLLGNTPELAARHLLWYGWIINLNLVLIVGKESVVSPVGEGMQDLSSLPHKWPRNICVSFPETFLSRHWVLCGLENLGTKKRLLVTWFFQTLVILVISPYTQTRLDLGP